MSQNMFNEEVPQFNLRDYEPLDLEVRELKDVSPSWEAGVMAEAAGDYKKAVRIFVDGRLFEDALSVIESHSLQAYAIQHLADKAEKYRTIGRDSVACRFDAVREIIESDAAELTDIEFLENKTLPLVLRPAALADELTDIEFIVGQQPHIRDAELSREDFIVKPAVDAVPAEEAVSERQSAAEIMVGGFIASIVGHHKKGNGVNGYNHREGHSMVDPEAEKKLRDTYRKGGELAESCELFRDAIHNYVYAQAFGEAERVAKKHELDMFYRSTLVEVAAQYTDESKAEPFRAEFDKLRETTKEI